MRELLIHPRRAGDRPELVAVTPESAGWEHVGFEVLALGPGATVGRELRGREACLVPLEGTCSVTAGEESWPALGSRPTPFDGPPEALYLPPGRDFSVAAAGGPAEVAICTAPARGGLEPHRIAADPARVEQRGEGAFAREIRPILMDEDRAEAESLLVCEVITPAGHWSSFPPHKHDREALPEESLLEETYYHRLRPDGGFALQRVYDGGELDETLAVGDRDTVLVPRGYHVVSAPPGYDLYYLNVMAGPARRWAFQDDPRHAWIGAGAGARS